MSVLISTVGSLEKDRFIRYQNFILGKKTRFCDRFADPLASLHFVYAGCRYPLPEIDYKGANYLEIFIKQLCFNDVINY